MTLTISQGHGVHPHGALAQLADPVVAAAHNLGPPFFCIEVQTYKPGTTTYTFSQGHGSHPHGALAELADSVEGSGVILASDLGYRTKTSDPLGLRVYPPHVDQAFAVDRRVNLDPAQSGLGAAWGTITLANANRTYDAIAAAWNSDGRQVRVLWGQKSWDYTRGIFLDPSYLALAPVFVGVATPWFLSDAALEIPLRDPSYWIERPLQTTLYLGTGTYEGPAALTGTPKPKARGGTSGNPICNVTPVLIDPTNRIYQYTDGPGTVVNLYEGGALTIVLQGNTTNLYSGSTSAGQYRTDNSRGLFQLGSVPVRTITCDVTGQFPIAGAVTTAAQIARYLLTEDLAIPASFIESGSFTTVDIARPYVSGIYFGPNDSPDGATALQRVLTSFAAQLLPTRSGQLRLVTLRALPVTAVPVAAFTPANVIACVPRSLPGTIDPPPYRFRVGYQHNYTTQDSDIGPTTTDTHRQFIAAADRYASASSAAVLSGYRRPNDTAPIGVALLVQTDAQTVANELVALWSTRRRVYDVTVPVAPGLAIDAGDVVSLTYPTDDLHGGKLAQVVGEQFRSQDATTTLQVLV
jgi:hypothetical protein